MKSPALWVNRQTLSEFQSSLCPTNALAYKAVYAAMLYEKKMNAFGYAREREQFIEKAREKCRNWRNEFENQFKTSCDLSLAEFGPLAADLCIMVLITVLFYTKNFKIYLVILLALEGATLGYNLFIILETFILYFHSIHSQSEGLKDVTMNCDYYERIFIIRITLLFISTVLIITFSLVSVQVFKNRKRKSKTESSVDEVDLNWD